MQFVIAGNPVQQRLHVQQLFIEAHLFYNHGFLWLEPEKEGEPKMSGHVVIAADWIDKLLLHEEMAPRFGLDFPARCITTNMLWSDAVLHPQTQQQINDIGNWLQYNTVLHQDENLQRKLKRGYHVFFYGAPGTGKIVTAALLGRQFNKLKQNFTKYIIFCSLLVTAFSRSLYAFSLPKFLFFHKASAILAVAGSFFEASLCTFNTPITYESYRQHHSHYRRHFRHRAGICQTPQYAQ